MRPCSESSQTCKNKTQNSERTLVSSTVIMPKLKGTYLEMPPRLLPAVVLVELPHNGSKLITSHFRQPIVIHNSPAITLPTPNDVTARRLRVVLSINAVPEIYPRSTPKRRQYPPRARRVLARQTRYQV